MYSYEVQGNVDKNFTSDDLLGKEGDIIDWKGLQLFIAVVDGDHVFCLEKVSEFPANLIELQRLKSEYFADADYFRDDN